MAGRAGGFLDSGDSCPGEHAGGDEIREDRVVMTQVRADADALSRPVVAAEAEAEAEAAISLVCVSLTEFRSRCGQWHDRRPGRTRRAGIALHGVPAECWVSPLWASRGPVADSSRDFYAMLDAVGGILTLRAFHLEEHHWRSDFGRSLFRHDDGSRVELCTGEVATVRAVTAPFLSARSWSRALRD